MRIYFLEHNSIFNEQIEVNVHFENIYQPPLPSHLQLGPVPSKDMQTPPLRNGPIFMKNAQCAETNEKSIFRFIF